MMYYELTDRNNHLDVCKRSTINHLFTIYIFDLIIYGDSSKVNHNAITKRKGTYMLDRIPIKEMKKI